MLVIVKNKPSGVIKTYKSKVKTADSPTNSIDHLCNAWKTFQYHVSIERIFLLLEGALSESSFQWHLEKSFRIEIQVDIKTIDNQMIMKTKEGKKK